MESASRKHRRSFRIRITSTSALMFQSSSAPSAGSGERLYSVIFEIREDAEGEFLHLVTLWKATSEERKLYEENS